MIARAQDSPARIAYPSARRTTGLFFGSFDPVTRGHLGLIARAFEQGVIDDLIILVRRKRGKGHLLSRPNAASLFRVAFSPAWADRVTIEISRAPFILVPRRADICIRGVRNDADRVYERRVRFNTVIGSLLCGRRPIPTILLDAERGLGKVSSTQARRLLGLSEPPHEEFAEIVPGAAADLLLRARAALTGPLGLDSRDEFNASLAGMLAGHLG